MEKSSPKVTVTVKNGLAKACFITTLGVIEEVEIKSSEKCVDLVENFCKRHCYGLVIKHVLLAEIKKQLRLQRENREKELSSCGKIGEKKEIEGNCRGGKVKNCRRNEGYAQVYKKKGHRRAASDGSPCLQSVKPLKDIGNSQVEGGKIKEKKKRSFVLGENARKRVGSLEKIIYNKAEKREFPINNLPEYLTRLHEKNKDKDDYQLPIKQFSSELSQTIKSRLIYLRCKEIFQRLRPNEKIQINEETILKHNLESWQAKILHPLLEEICNYHVSLSFDDFFESASALFTSLSPCEVEALVKNNDQLLIKKRNNGLLKANKSTNGMNKIFKTAMKE